MPQEFEDEAGAGSGIAASTVIAEIRRKLGDEDAGNYRWSDSILLGYVDSGHRDVCQKRPDLFMKSDLSGLNTPGVLTLSTALYLDERWLAALGLYGAFRALSEDGNDAGDTEQGLRYWQQYLLELGIASG